MLLLEVQVPVATVYGLLIPRLIFLIQILLVVSVLDIYVFRLVVSVQDIYTYSGENNNLQCLYGR